MRTQWPWSDSGWRQIFERIVQHAEAVVCVCTLQGDDYKALISRKVHRISDKATQRSVLEHAAMYGDMIEFIADGLDRCNRSHAIPASFVWPTVDLAAHRSAWTKHISGEPQNLKELKELAQAVVSRGRAALKEFDSQDGVEYSSYSDYSEDETSSDDDFDDEDEDDDEDKKTDKRPSEKPAKQGEKPKPDKKK